MFKVLADKHGYLHMVRVYSGELKANSRIYNSTLDKKENAAQLWQVQADSRRQIDRVEAGDIVGVIGLRDSATGDTLCDAKRPIRLPAIIFPETVISMAIEPETSAERKKLAERLELLKRQDPTFRAIESEETGQTLISGMGELHLEIIKNRLLRDFNLNVKVHNPRVSYRESIAKAVEVTGECHRQVAGQATFGKVRIRMAPEAGGEVVTVAPGASEEITPEFLSVVVDSLKDRCQGGGNFGNPLMDLKITVLGGETHELESTDVSFRIAAVDAFDKALRAAGAVLMEPVMKLEISTPEEFMGEFVADLQQRRATITRTDTRGSLTVINAEAPLAELFGYSSAMRSLSQGRASSSMQPLRYGPAPKEFLDRFM